MIANERGRAGVTFKHKMWLRPSSPQVLRGQYLPALPVCRAFINYILEIWIEMVRTQQ